jgi:hypothetical protein
LGARPTGTLQVPRLLFSWMVVGYAHVWLV